MFRPVGNDRAEAFASSTPNPGALTGTIANGASLTAGIDLTPGRAVAIVFPAAWTAAGVTFQGGVVEDDGTVTYYDLLKADGTELNLTWVASKLQALDPNIFLGFAKLKIRSGTSALPVAQGAARDFRVLTLG